MTKFSITTLATILLTATVAYANPSSKSCPKLAGYYVCKGDVKDFSDDSRSKTMIMQAEKNGVTKFWLPATENFENPAYIRFADGKIRSKIEDDSHLGTLKWLTRTVCVGGVVHDRQKAAFFDRESGQSAPYLDVTTDYSITADRQELTVKQTIKQTLLEQTTEMTRTSVCKRSYTFN